MARTAPLHELERLLPGLTPLVFLHTGYTNFTLHFSAVCIDYTSGEAKRGAYGDSFGEGYGAALWIREQ